MPNIVAIDRDNNIGWLRLIIATQVAVRHGLVDFYDLGSYDILAFFRGTPFFFFLSGFLIYESYLKNQDPWRFYQRRAIRLLPMVYLSTLATVLILLWFVGPSLFVDHPFQSLIWLFNQLTVMQTVWPPAFAEYSKPFSNGPLWFISTILILYLCVPLIARVEAYFPQTVLVLIAVSLVVSVVLAMRDEYTLLALDRAILTVQSLDIVSAVAKVSHPVIVSFWMFGLGILLRRNAQIFTYFINRPLYFVAAIALSITLSQAGFLPVDALAPFHPLYFFGYVGVALFIAFKTPRLRQIPDLSMGVFVWHMPIFKILMYNGIANLPVGMLLTFIVAAVSYRYIESPIARRLESRSSPKRSGSIDHRV